MVTLLPMPVLRYSDSIRMQAISLYLQGKGYKAIGSELKLPRDTVRGWIRAYRQKEGDEIERQEPQDTTQLAEREAMYAAAREEYESSPASRTPLPSSFHSSRLLPVRPFVK